MEIDYGKYLQQAFDDGYAAGQKSMGIWIPCSERLPDVKERTRFLITTNRGNVLVSHFYPANKCSEATWAMTYGENRYGTPASKSVRAWMPLPLPYKEEEDGKIN